MSSVACFPVKGASSVPLDAVVLDPSGVVGDRCFAVIAAGPDRGTDGLADSRGVLTAEQAPRLRDVRAGIGGPGDVRVDVPGHGDALTGDAADRALTAFLGRPVRLRSVTAGSQVDAPVHLVSIQAVAAARRGEHAASGCACSLEEHRANLELDLSGDDAPREERWMGRLIAVGDAVLRVHRRPGHCLGAYAEVLRPGRVAVGDVVREVSGGAEHGA